MALREHQFSLDDQVLRDQWPAVRKAIEFLIGKDGNDDGMLEGPQLNTYDGPAGELGFAPQLSPENFKAFFTAAEGWGNLVQQRKADQQINRLELKWGTLRLKTLQLQLPPGAKFRDASVTAADRPLEITTKQDGHRVEITLTEPHVLETNQALAVELSFSSQ